MTARPPTLAWFHCFSGIAGDMTLGALIDAGADVDEIRGLVGRLPIRGWELRVEATLRGGIAATDVTVAVEETSVVRTAAHIEGLIEEARLPERVRRRALATFAALAGAEGPIHRRPADQVHFHEVGGLDAIVDIVGSCAALEVLDVDEVHASAITVGQGVINAAHGTLPNPAPATVALLRGLPVRGIDVDLELTTPTGAALLAALAEGFGPMPAMTVQASGFGAGDLELPDRPNLTQVVLGERSAAMAPGQPVTQLDVNVDDATGETLAHAIAAVLDAGAHDAWVTPIVMKKGRPAHMVSALCDPVLAAQVARTLVRESGSLGVRGRQLERWPEARTTERVDVEGRPVRVKVSAGRVKVEHDDAAKVAGLTGLPLREVVSLAEEAYRRRSRDEKVDDEPPDTVA